MKAVNIIISVMVFGLICSCGNECDDKMAQLQDSLDNYKLQLANMETFRSEYEKRLDEYKTTDSILNLYEDSVRVIREQLQSTRYASSYQNQALERYMEHINRLLEENETLAIELKDYIDESGMATLSQETVVDILITKIEEKNQQIADMQQQIIDLKSQVTGLEADMKVKEKIIAKQDDQIEDITEEFKKFEATGISYQFINKSGEEIKTPKLFLSKIKEFRIMFTLKENGLVETGNIDILLRVEQEKGDLINVWYTQQRIQAGIAYTEKISVYYYGLEQYCTISWDRGDYKLESGRYKATLYTGDGKEIGFTLFEL